MLVFHFHSTEPCPDVVRSVDRISFLWVLFWPVYVVGWGLVVGYLMAMWSCTPRHQIRSVLAAVAFANSTGLPITLFSVLSINSIQGGRGGNSPVVDPTLLLSIYLLSYPMLQWGVGGWLLTPENESSSDATTTQPQVEMEQSINGHDYHPLESSEIPLLPVSSDPLTPPSTSLVPTDSEQPLLDDSEGTNSDRTSSADNNSRAPVEYCMGLIVKVIRRCLLQPPVVAAILGFIVAAIPKLRGIFVDIVDRDDDAPTQWFFDALYTVGQAAVPINMILLGSNLSQSFRTQLDDEDKKSVLLSKRTMASIVFGKLILMPLIGIGSVSLLTYFVWNLPESTYIRVVPLIPVSNVPFHPLDVHASFCLVTMMSFLTPTANNVMVMVELSGGNREGIARVIAWQYLAAPLVLSLTVSFAVGIANSSLSWHATSGSSPTVSPSIGM